MNDLPSMDLLLVPCLPTLLNNPPKRRQKVFQIEENESPSLENDFLVEYFGPNLWQPWMEFAPEQWSPDPQILHKVKASIEDIKETCTDSLDVERPDLSDLFPQANQVLGQKMEVPKLDFDSEQFGQGVLFPVFTLNPADLKMLNEVKLLRKADKILDDMLNVSDKFARLRAYHLEPCLVSQGATTRRTHEMEDFMEVIEAPSPVAPSFKALFNTLDPVQERRSLMEVEDGCKFIKQAAVAMRQVFRHHLNDIRQDCQSVIRSILIDVIENVPAMVESMDVEMSLVILKPTESGPCNEISGIGPKSVSDREQLARLTAQMQLESNPAPRWETSKQNTSPGTLKCNGRSKPPQPSTSKTIRSRSFVQLDVLPDFGYYPILKKTPGEVKHIVEEDQDRHRMLEHISGSSDSKEDGLFSDLLSKSGWNVNSSGDSYHFQDSRPERINRTMDNRAHPEMENLFRFGNSSTWNVEPTNMSTPLKLNTSPRDWKNTIFQESFNARSDDHPLCSRITSADFYPTTPQPEFSSSKEVPCIVAEQRENVVVKRRPRKKIRSKLTCLDPLLGLC